MKIIQPAKVSKENLKEKVVADSNSEKSTVKAILQETKNGESNLSISCFVSYKTRTRFVSYHLVLVHCKQIINIFTYLTSNSLHFRFKKIVLPKEFHFNLFRSIGKTRILLFSLLSLSVHLFCSLLLGKYMNMGVNTMGNTS